MFLAIEQDAPKQVGQNVDNIVRLSLNVQSSNIIVKRNLHMFLEILKLRVENKPKCLGKTVLKMWSQKSTRSISFVLRIRQR